MNSEQTENPDMPARLEPRDEFASGQENRLRRLFLRLLRWLFSPPYFPSPLIWFLIALAATDIASDLLRQKPEYWADPSISTRFALVIPFSWGPWVLLLFALGYMIAVGLVLTFITERAALMVWTTASLAHLFSISHSFSCQVNPRFAFIDPAYCAQWYALALALGGVLMAIGLACALRLGLFPRLTGHPEAESPPRPRLPIAITLGSFAWILLLGVGLGFAAFRSKPEWRQVQTLHAPGARTSAALAYDTKRMKAVLFGGTSNWTKATGWNALNDTWEWDGADWNQLAPATGPSPRFAAVSAYDETRGVTVLFGGTNPGKAYPSNFYGDTWEWDGTDWAQRKSTISPSARAAGNLFYDPQRKKVVLYAGYYNDESGKSIYLDDAWEWDGQAWEQIKFSKSKVNASSAMIYYEKQQLPILADGEGIWFWKDSRWSKPGFPETPPARWGSSLAFDPALGQIVLFGGFQGNNGFNDTWAFDGVTWKKVVTGGAAPPIRNGQRMFYDLVRHRIVIFGGGGYGKGLSLYNDTWELVQP